MNKESVIYTLSVKFSLRIIEMGRYLLDKYEHDKILPILVRQIVRCGTSVGANVSESMAAQSTADHINKLKIALKEGDETRYWLELLNKSKYLSDSEYLSIDNDCSILNGTLVNMNNKNLEK
ncbi:MAG: four helix bundle protein [Prevotella sp.]|nr:four helix bundle protein [Prevotella sp.]